MASNSKEIVRSKRICCVVGCYNSEQKNHNLTFYSFPGKKWEVERKNKWIKAIRRRMKNGQPWKPSSNSRVCSEHFVGGKKSENSNSEAYIPTIFPAIYREKNPPMIKGSKKLLIGIENVISSSETVKTENIEEDLSQNFMENKIITTKNNDDGGIFENDYCLDNIKIEMDIDEEPKTTFTSVFIVEKKLKIEQSTIGCQTDPCMDISFKDTNTLFCWNDGNEASTQTQIYVRMMPLKEKKIIVVEKTVKTENKSCGSDVNMNFGFLGVEDIESDQTMRQLAGVTKSFFSVLLNQIKLGKDGQPHYYKKVNKENRLLMFLMKLKLGITFCALGCMFHVHGTTASRIFTEILKTLTAKTKSWISWPSKETIKQNLPKTFKKFPNCRCIIDFIQVQTDTPPTEEQKVLLYSDQNDKFMSKFFLAITPDGYICKISDAYGGKTDDAFIMQDCGFVDLIEPDDVIFAGKVSPEIELEFTRRKVTLLISEKAKNVDADATFVRVHVERAVNRIKELRVLEHVPLELLPQISDIMHMCCIVANG